MSGYANEETGLLNHHGNSGNNNGIAASMSFGLGSVIGGLQVVAFPNFILNEFNLYSFLCLSIVFQSN